MTFRHLSVTVRLLMILSCLLPTLSLGQSNPEVLPDLSCSPAPCILPTVTIWPQGDEFSPLAVNSKNPQQLMLGLNPFGPYIVMNSSDAGQTWTKSDLPDLGFGGQATYVTPAYDANGVAHVVWTDGAEVEGAQVAMITSSDNGATWSAPKIVQGLTTVAQDLAIDNSPSSPFLNTMYLAFGRLDPNDNPADLEMAISSNGGSTWNTRVIEPSSYMLGVCGSFAQLATAKDGRVYLTWMMAEDDACQMIDIMESSSTDGGKHWSPPGVVDTLTLPSGHNVFYEFPSIAVDHSAHAFSGRVYIAFHKWTGVQFQAVVTSSSDQGATWSVPTPVSPAGTYDQINPWMDVSSSGTVGVTWLDLRDDPRHQKYHAYAAVSADGGNLFGNSLLLSTQYSTYSPSVDAWSGTRLYAIFTPTTSSNVTFPVIGGVQLKH